MEHDVRCERDLILKRFSQMGGVSEEELSWVRQVPREFCACQARIWMGTGVTLRAGLRIAEARVWQAIGDYRTAVGRTVEENVAEFVARALATSRGDNVHYFQTPRDKRKRDSSSS